MPKKTTFTIVCLGDSITCDWDAPSWVDHLRKLTTGRKQPIEIINSGIKGETAQDAYYRLDRDVITYQPNLVIIMFGHNEIRLGQSPAMFQQYMKKILNQIERKTSAQIWLLAPNDLGDETHKPKYQPCLDVLKNIAKQRRIKLVWLFDLFEDREKSDIFTFQMNESFRIISG